MVIRERGASTKRFSESLRKRAAVDSICHLKQISSIEDMILVEESKQRTMRTCPRIARDLKKCEDQALRINSTSESNSNSSLNPA